MSVAAKPKLDLATSGPLPGRLDAPPPIVFSGARRRPRRRQSVRWNPLRSAVIAAVVVAVVIGTFLALGYLFGEAILGG